MAGIKMSAPFVQMYKVFQKRLGEEEAQEIVDELYKTIEEIKKEQATKEGLDGFRVETKEEFESLRREQELLKLSLEAKIEELKKEQQVMRLELEAKIEELKKEQQAMRLELEAKIEENRKAVEELKKEQQAMKLELEAKIEENRKAIEELKKEQQAMRLEIEEVKREIKALEVRLVEKIYETKTTIIFWILGTWLLSVFMLFIGKIFKIY